MPGPQGFGAGLRLRHGPVACSGDRRGAQLIADDRDFAKVVRDELRVLPWPSAAAIGLVLLDTLGLYDVVRDRLQAGEQASGGPISARGGRGQVDWRRRQPWTNAG
ncbi:hypothetical protein ACFYZJ_11060 [Streptomyces sp. NPDC001848]|uniref:hypothetical protein n=1 Tax=Streptomyces sp. NPDC001848 TaxID=3364618 RepID=UPI0036AB710A